MERTDAIARLTSYALDRTASDFDRDALLDIADAIEREAKANRVDAYTKGYDEGFASADDWAAQHEDAMAEHGWVRLPVDAEGECIHVGDVMEWVDIEGTVEVVCTVDAVGVDCFFAWDAANCRYAQKHANAYRHHHAPTVEDVLREFADRVCNSGHQWGLDADTTIAEYAAKLRLAGDE